jgi:hypothetical protein
MRIIHAHARIRLTVLGASNNMLTIPTVYTDCGILTNDDLSLIPADRSCPLRSLARLPCEHEDSAVLTRGENVEVPRATAVHHSLPGELGGRRKYQQGSSQFGYKVLYHV